MLFQFTRISRNKKTGAIPTTISPRQTCPESCSLKGAGCYAEVGHTAIYWNKVSKNEAGIPYDELLANIRALPRGQLWRHNVAGDLLGNNGIIDSKALYDLCDANTGRYGFTYTHYSANSNTPQGAYNAAVIEAANSRGFVVNISTDSVNDALSLREQTSAPIVTVVPENYWQDIGANWVSFEDSENIVARCPAEYKQITCDDCRACAVSNRKAIIAFTAHGTRKRIMSENIRSRMIVTDQGGESAKILE